MTFSGFLILALLTSPQVQHAPTVAQCQADERLWMDKIETDTALQPEFYVIDGWRSEMSDCQKVDAVNQQKYYNLESEIIADEAGRMMDFLQRHNLTPQFLLDDSNGKR